MFRKQKLPQYIGYSGSSISRAIYDIRLKLYSQCLLGVSEKNEIKLDLTKTANESNVQITSNKVCNLGRISKIAASPRDIEPYENDVFQIF